MYSKLELEINCSRKKFENKEQKNIISFQNGLFL